MDAVLCIINAWFLNNSFQVLEAADFRQLLFDSMLNQSGKPVK